MKKILALLILAALVGGAVLAFRLLPWWALASLVVLGLIAAKLLLPRLLKRLILIPFKAKGQVLRNARAQVHSVIPSAQPADFEEASDPNGPAPAHRTWFTVDVTIEPAPSCGPFQLWEPCSLRLLGPEAARQLGNIDAPSDDTVQVHHVEVHDGNRFVRDEGMKYGGAQRVRLQVGLATPLTRCLFAYYLETFGEVTFHTQALAAAS